MAASSFTVVGTSAPTAAATGNGGGGGVIALGSSSSSSSTSGGNALPPPSASDFQASAFLSGAWVGDLSIDLLIPAPSAKNPNPNGFVVIGHQDNKFTALLRISNTSVQDISYITCQHLSVILFVGKDPLPEKASIMTSKSGFDPEAPNAAALVHKRPIYSSTNMVYGPGHPLDMPAGIKDVPITIECDSTTPPTLTDPTVSDASKDVTYVVFVTCRRPNQTPVILRKVITFRRGVPWVEPRKVLLEGNMVEGKVGYQLYVPEVVYVGDPTAAVSIILSSSDSVTLKSIQCQWVEILEYEDVGKSSKHREHSLSKVMRMGDTMPFVQTNGSTIHKFEIPTQTASPDGDYRAVAPNIHPRLKAFGGAARVTHEVRIKVEYKQARAINVNLDGIKTRVPFHCLVHSGSGVVKPPGKRKKKNRDRSGSMATSEGYSESEYSHSQSQSVSGSIVHASGPASHYGGSAYMSRSGSMRSNMTGFSMMSASQFNQSKLNGRLRQSVGSSDGLALDVPGGTSSSGDRAARKEKVALAGNLFNTSDAHADLPSYDPMPQFDQETVISSGSSGDRHMPPLPHSSNNQQYTPAMAQKAAEAAREAREARRHAAGENEIFRTGTVTDAPPPFSEFGSAGIGLNGVIPEPQAPPAFEHVSGSAATPRVDVKVAPTQQSQPLQVVVQPTEPKLAPVETISPVSPFPSTPPVPPRRMNRDAFNSLPRPVRSSGSQDLPLPRLASQRVAATSVLMYQPNSETSSPRMFNSPMSTTPIMSTSPMISPLSTFASKPQVNFTESTPPSTPQTNTPMSPSIPASSSSPKPPPRNSSSRVSMITSPTPAPRMSSMAPGRASMQPAQFAQLLAGAGDQGNFTMSPRSSMDNPSSSPVNTPPFSSLRNSRHNSDTIANVEILEHLVGIQKNAIVPFEPKFDDEIAVQVGDIMFVRNAWSDGFAHGFNVRTNREGIFPQTCLFGTNTPLPTNQKPFTSSPLATSDSITDSDTQTNSSGSEADKLPRRSTTKDGVPLRLPSRTSWKPVAEEESEDEEDDLSKSLDDVTSGGVSASSSVARPPQVRDCNGLVFKELSLEAKRIQKESPLAMMLQFEHYVIHPFVPKASDEMMAATGDTVMFGIVNEDGWAWGLNETQSVKGFFPVVIFGSEFGGPPASALTGTATPYQ